jgi:Ricin-type beta-trefoil lectin domain-like/PA14 domain/Secretion system C-terminal sorting domain
VCKFVILKLPFFNKTGNMKILINNLLSTCFKQTSISVFSLSLLFVGLLTTLTQQAQAQTPTLAWQKLFGGDVNEDIVTIQPTTDGGYIVAGSTTSSNSGDIGLNHGAVNGTADCWVAKLNASGALQWKKTLGGDITEVITSIQQTKDGGYILIGTTNSFNSGNVGTNNHGGPGDEDCWVVKLNASGTVQWQKLLGGNNTDNGVAIKQTTDGGYILAAKTLSSNSGDVGLNHGGNDYWIAKLGTTGAIQWQKTLGGSNEESVSDIQLTADGGYIVSGTTNSSNTGDVGLLDGRTHSWLVKLNGSGTIQWQKSLGLNRTDGDSVLSIQQTADGGYITVGSSGYVSASFTNTDARIVKTNATGTIEWEKTLGGNDADIAVSIQQTRDGGYIMVGYTNSSNSGVIGATKGDFDGWIIKLNASGILEWQKTLGGDRGDLFRTVRQTADGGFIIAGWTNSSNSGDIGANRGGSDFWVVKLNASNPSNLDPTKCYRIVSKVTGKALEVKNGLKTDGTQIYQWTFNNTSNQLWQIVKLSDGKYNIISKNSGKLMDVVDNTPAGRCVDGTIIQQFPAHGTTSQKWRLEIQADDSYKIYSETCNKPLRLEGGSFADGASVGIKTDLGTESFKWFIQESPCALPLCTQNGQIQVERWLNYTSTAFPLIVPTSEPTAVVTQSDTEGPWNYADNFFTRVKGYIRPSESGNYTFNVTGDDQAEFFLSNGTSPSAMTRRAYTANWTGSTEYTKYPTQTSNLIALKANQLYYFEIRHKDITSGDVWRLSWKTPSNATFQPITTQFLASACSNLSQGSATQETVGFEARAVEGRAKLQWFTNAGYKNDYFEVERLNTQGSFDVLDRQNATATNDVAYYTFNDYNPFEGDNFYRIHTITNVSNPQIQAEYSEIKKVSFTKNDLATLFPNPADDYMNIDLRQYEGKAVHLYFYNSLGTVLKKTTIDKATSAPQRIDIQELPTGSYLVLIQAEGKRVLKQLLNVVR